MNGTMSKTNQMALLRQCAVLLAKNVVCNEPSVIEWLRIVFAAHRLGYLYCGFKQDGSIDIACIAYRIKDASIQTRGDLPDREEGDILYVTAVASESDDTLKLYRLMRWYLNNNLDIKTVAYDYRNQDVLHVHKVRRKS